MFEQRYAREVRASSEKEFKIYGYAARYGTVADIGDFDETVEEGAFDRCVRERQDVKCLFNHDASAILGRTVNGTLLLTADKQGLYFECQLDPARAQHKEVYAAVQRGDISECSFAFSVPEGKQTFTMQASGKPLRRISDMNLFDVSAVTYPAYKQGTSVAARTYFDVEARSALTKAFAFGLGAQYGIVDEDMAASWLRVTMTICDDIGKQVEADKAAGLID